jgi:DNA-binding transcriptional regulator of glucitol operon
MNTWLLVGIICVLAYLVQILLGLQQIKNFNQVYQRLRRQGRVAIGRRPGKIRSGTIILFALDAKGVIQETQKMQGISVIAKFKRLDQFNGLALQALTAYHPLVSKELKITRQAIENARDLFIRVQAGDYQETSALSPVVLLKNQVFGYGQQLKMLLKK